MEHKRIKIFLASSRELAEERKGFTREIAARNKLLEEQGVFLDLQICEDLSARVFAGGSQRELDDRARDADLFVLLAGGKVGPYTAGEFDAAFDSFQARGKPFIFTYFREGVAAEPSRERFAAKLRQLSHYCPRYTDFHHLWTQFNRELDRLLLQDFALLTPPGGGPASWRPGKHIGGLPVRSEVFLGREEACEELRRQLSGGESLLLLVNGSGGIGKTTLAAHY